MLLTIYLYLQPKFLIKKNKSYYFIFFQVKAKSTSVISTTATTSSTTTSSTSTQNLIELNTTAIPISSTKPLATTSLNKIEIILTNDEQNSSQLSLEANEFSNKEKKSKENDFLDFIANYCFYNINDI